MKKPLYIYGASGHAKVIIDIAERMECWKIEGLLDDNAALAGQKVLGYPILGGREWLRRLNPLEEALFPAIGANATRHRIGREVKRLGFHIPTLVHPSAVIAREVTIGYGTAVMAGVVVNPATEIGPLCILNTSCTVDHDGRLGTAVHISPGAHLAGNVTVGDESWVGIGSSVIEGRSIGKRAMVGGGAVVVNDIPDDVTVVGIPARPLPKHTLKEPLMKEET